MMMKAQLLFILAGLTLGPLSLGAQTPEAAEEVSFEALLYPPELIMQHRRAIELNDEQRDAITRMIQELQGRVVALQWNLLDETQSLKDLLERPRVDQDRALDLLEEVLKREAEIKRAHLELLIRIKNVLTPDQQEALDRLRRTGTEETGGDPGPGGTPVPDGTP